MNKLIMFLQSIKDPKMKGKYLVCYSYFIMSLERAKVKPKPRCHFSNSTMFYSLHWPLYFFPIHKLLIITRVHGQYWSTPEGVVSP